MRTSSLRIRLLALAVASIVVTLAVAGISLTVMVEQHYLQRVGRELDLRWTELATVFARHAGPLEGFGELLADPRYKQPYSGAYWQVSEGGKPVRQSRSLWDQVIETASVDPASHNGEPFEVIGPKNAELYVIEREVKLGGEAGQRSFRLAVALDHEEVVELREALAGDLLVILGLIAVVLTGMAWLQLRHGLGPLRALGRELKAVHEGHRARLPARFPDEIAPLVADLNALLDRQERLVRKARDRAGSLAHGLKTPLTIMAGEVRRLERSGSGDAARRLAEQIAAIRLHVDRELARSRASGSPAAVGAYTAAGETVEKLFRLMRRMPRGDGIDWRCDIPPGLRVRMEPDDFGEVMGNLLDNARKWARTTVAVRAEPEGDTVRIVVEDDGPGFPAGASSALPERGVPGRADASSTGLGLAIVRDLLQEYGVALAIGRGLGKGHVAFEVGLSRPEAPAGKAQGSGTSPDREASAAKGRAADKVLG